MVRASRGMRRRARFGLVFGMGIVLAYFFPKGASYSVARVDRYSA